MSANKEDQLALTALSYSIDRFSSNDDKIIAELLNLCSLVGISCWFNTETNPPRAKDSNRRGLVQYGLTNDEYANWQYIADNPDIFPQWKRIGEND